MGSCPELLITSFKHLFIGGKFLQLDKAINYLCILFLMTNNFTLTVPWVYKILAPVLAAPIQRLTRHFAAVGCDIKVDKATLVAPIKFPSFIVSGKDYKFKK